MKKNNALRYTLSVQGICWGLIIEMVFVAASSFLMSQNADSLSRARAARESYRLLKLESADEVENMRIEGRDILKATGRVRFSQDTLSARCDQAAFYREKQIALMIGSVALHDGHRWIFAEKARYYAKQKKAVCEGNVLFVDGRMTLTADSLVYYQNIEQLFAQGSVVIYDSIEAAASYGSECFYDVKKKYFYAKGNPYLIQYDSTVYQGQNIARLKRGWSSPPWTDSLGNSLRYKPEEQIFIRGHFVESWIDSHRVFVRDSAVFIRDRLIARAGQAVYHTKEEILWMDSLPQAVYDRSNIQGLRMQVQFRQKEIEQILVTGDAAASAPADTLTGKRNRLNAKTITMNIRARKMQTLVAEGNAYNRYYLESGEGVNEITGPKMILFFDEKSRMKNFLVNGGTQGTYYPKAFEYLLKK